jgi:methylthioxylose transferase
MAALSLPRVARGDGWVLAGAGAVVLAAAAIGRGLTAGEAPFIGAAPFAGRWDAVAPLRLLPAVAVAGLVTLLWDSGTRRLSWSPMLACVAAAAGCWTVALAASDGVEALTAPLLGRHDYLVELPAVISPAQLLREFVGLAPELSTHVKAHPPGMLLVLWLLAESGLSGANWAAAVCIGGGLAGLVAVLVATREVVGEEAARRLAPFLVLFPGALWLATSADSFMLGVSAWGVALVVLASGRTGRRSTVLAAAGGLLLGFAVMLSYGLVLVAAPAAAVLVARRRWTVGLVAAAAAGFVVLAAGLSGFWWWEGLAVTRGLYEAGVAAQRPYWYFVLANVAVVAVAAGPAAVAGLGRMRNALLVGAVAAVALANLSGLSKGEVERIWLPFLPWLVVGAAGIASHRRLWLSASASTAVGLELVLRSPW